jgi:Transposase DDE domain
VYGARRNCWRGCCCKDVEEKTDASGTPTTQIKEGTTPGRSPSASDPEARHGRKSASKKFVGYQSEILVDVESQIIVATEVLGADEGDATEVLEVVKQGETNTGQTIEETKGDCAYGSGETRQAFAEEGRTLTARVPAEGNNRGMYPKSRFELDVLNERVTCPAGQTTSEYREEKDGGKVFTFGAVCGSCPRRAACTTAAGGRTVRMHPQEELLQAARAQQETPEGRAALRERVVVEHRLARMGQLGAGQARYAGRRKTKFQIAILATIANLRWTWNWAAARAKEAMAEPVGLAQAA